MKFRVLGGEHVSSDGKVYKKGDILSSDVNLVNIFTNKFELVEDTVPVTKAETSPSIKKTLPIIKVNSSEKIEEPIKEQAEKLIVKENQLQHVKAEIDNTEMPKIKKGMKDMTKKFNIALRENLKVFRKGYDYFIYEEDDLKNGINEKGLKSLEVEPFITKYIEE